MATEDVTPLCELALKYGTDKFNPHQYTPVYWSYLADRRERVTKVLEIGIAKGAKSLRMWEEFFPNAQIYGVDVDNRWMFNEGRIQSFKCDQTDSVRMYQIGKRYGPFDLIVEDGNHNPRAQLAAMAVMLRWVDKRGLYFMEDIWIDRTSMAMKVPHGYVHEFYRSAKQEPNIYMMCVRRA